MVRLDVSVAAETHAGMVRDHNEDAVLADGLVFAIADGMGGHEAGEVASAAVVRALGALHHNAHNGAISPEQLVAALDAAQYDVVSISSGGPRSAGSTVAGVAVVDFREGLHWLVFNIGDSRVYRYLDGELRQLTVDHSLVQQMVDEGTLTAKEALSAPGRNVITRALGAADHEPALFLIPVIDTERILICSDGLTNEITDAAISAVLAATPDTQHAVDRMLALALNNGGRDNVSLVLVDVIAGGMAHGERTGEVVTTAFEQELPDEDTAPRQSRS
ncbi:protein phosphatase [Micrococcales bacterium KH10]|nr:protein phosphatase [Micrococcales bacterium KH10]